MLWSAVSLAAVMLKYLLLLLIAAYCWFRWTHRELLNAAAKLPYFFPAFPIIGHSYFCFWGRDGLTRHLLKMTKMAVARGVGATVFWCGPLPILFVNDINDIKMILNNSNSLDKGSEYEFFKVGFDSEGDELTYSLLTAPGQRWKVARKYMNPLFHPRNLQHMIPVFNLNSRELVSCLSQHVGHGPVNLMPHTMDTALKTVCNLLFGPGVEIDIKSSKFHGLMTILETIPEHFINRLLRPWLRIESVFRFLYRGEITQMNFFYKNFTETPLRISKANSSNKGGASNTTNSSANDLPDLEDNQEKGLLNIIDAFKVLQQNHPEFTEVDMTTEMLTFYATGTDTVGSTVASCLLALAQHQDIQEQLYQDICTVVEPDDDVTLQDLNRIPYLDRVVKETLRWFSVVPYIMRRAENDMKLNSCTVPAGNTVVVCLGGINRNPRLFKNPHTFDPDHFAPERLQDIEGFYFVPFSGGPRNCIAKTYAMQLMKIMVVHVLRRYKLSTDMNISRLRKRLIVTMVNADGYNIRIQERN